jgi:hypothetical protein
MAARVANRPRLRSALRRTSRHVLCDDGRERTSSVHQAASVDGAIAGTAAAITCYSEASAHSQWAAAVIDRYRAAADEMTDDMFPGSVIPWHPKIFVVHALAARIRTGHEQSIDREALYRLVAHPLEAVSLVALSRIATCWERDQRFAWSGLNLGLRLAQLFRSRDIHRLTPEALSEVERTRRNAAAGFLLFGWVDPGGDGQFGWSRCDTLETLRVGQEGGVQGGAARSGERLSAAVMNGVRGHERDP